MATFVAHPLIAVGVARLARNIRGPELSLRAFVGLSILCHWIPDIDAVTVLLPLEHDHILAHRGVTHSFLFNFLFAAAVVRWSCREARLFSNTWCRLLPWFFFVGALHGITDGLVDTHVGSALFFPIDSGRYLLPWNPIPDAPIALSALGGAFWSALVVEIALFGATFSGLFLIARVRKLVGSGLQADDKPLFEDIT